MKNLGLWSSGLRNFLKKFVKPSGPASYLLNVRPPIFFQFTIQVNVNCLGTTNSKALINDLKIKCRNLIEVINQDKYFSFFKGEAKEF